MTAEPPSAFVLTADVAASGHFVRAGTIPIPAPAFATALKAFKDCELDSELREVLIYALAVKVAGRCVFESAQAANIAEACFQSRLISEWRISIPGSGVLQALFHIVRFERADGDGVYDIAFQLAGKPEFAAMPREIAGIP
jgi:Phage tail tube protein